MILSMFDTNGSLTAQDFDSLSQPPKQKHHSDYTMKI